MSKLSAQDVDRHIGSRIRLRRKTVGLTQQEVATRIGLSYQQLQKYETGDSRITASGLFELADVLDVPVDWFFDGLPRAASDPVDPNLALVATFLASPQGLRLAQSFCELPEGAARYKLVDFLEALVDHKG